MLIRVSTDPNNELYLNTDHVRSIAFRCKVCEIIKEPHQHITYCYVDLIGHSPNKPLHITEDAGRLILMLIEANDSLLDHNTLTPVITSPALIPPGPAFVPPDTHFPQASLTTRIAQLLRDTWKHASLNLIMAALNTHDAQEVLNALNQLIAEKVVISLDKDGDISYYHASQRAAFQAPPLAACPACGGSGQQPIDPFAESTESTPCYFCNGTGNVQPAEEAATEFDL